MVAEPMLDERPAPRPRPKAVATGRIVPIHVAVVGRPWWQAAGAVFSWGFSAILFPFRALIMAAELIMAGFVLVIVATAAGWYLGYIDDGAVVAALMPIGERLLSMVQGVSGL